MPGRKAFVYLLRRDGSRPRLLVFDSLDEPGLEVPKGAVEAGESFEEAAIREVREESGIEGIRVDRVLGATSYEDEEHRFLLADAPSGLPEAFDHTVTGGGADDGLRYRFRWAAIDATLRDTLVQGCGAFVDALLEAVRASSIPPHFGEESAMARSKRPITSVRNARIVAARKLTQRKHRRRQDRFLVEGLQILAMAAERLAIRPSEAKPLELFYCEELFVGETAPRLLRDLVQAGAEPIRVAAHVLDTLSEREASQGLVATFDLSALEASLDELWAAPSSEPALVVVLDRLQDPGNLGTLIRTSDAVGARAVVLVEPCVDPFDPKTVRGTMGSLFSVPFGRVEDVSGLWRWLKRTDLRPVGADATAGKAPWESDRLVGPVALVLGNEARGLDPDLRERLTDFVGLPLLGGAESLNVAVAGGILMYEWLRINRLPVGPRRDAGRI